MIETFDKIGYAEWDEQDFTPPDELRLDEHSSLQHALTVFYFAGGYDFFEVIRPEKYASNWLNFIGDLYAEIEDGRYQPDGTAYKIPLPEAKRIALIAQGVPDIFTSNIDGK